jgi:hypothetical protein
MARLGACGASTSSTTSSPEINLFIHSSEFASVLRIRIPERDPVPVLTPGYVIRDG